ncbi:serine/threonine protein kinase [Arthrobacter koreensis]|uniref:Serine/threonine protein kinase n=1 Tax=Arthrobacter koreensis TaxID=199136 RepID=A0ABY6FSE5_9MICC|nr:serine/threonine-protein kinase [Arthrobacter koreensis]UYB35962.1 serine/threonine protein kinase [Arthrobacter koreensis]
MTTVQIKLDKSVWDIGERLDADAGGFGQVFLASRLGEENAVAKFVRKEPGATREMLIGDFLAAQNATNVIPILDSGEHDGQWVLVMPRAEMSLQQRLQQAEPVELAECVRILADVARAMAGLGVHVVHRDLKPANVLLLDGRWCVADFGIARYAEAATATETRKFSWTPPFAAPEQWLLEHATAETDVYAFGVMAYLILEGRLPFPGPTAEDFREQHLGQTPPAPTAGTARLRNVILECLHKAPEARPTAANILVRLEKVTVEPALAGAQRLARLNAEEVRRRSQAHAEQRAVENERARRERLFGSASQMFESIVQPLLESIEDDVPTASAERNVAGNPLFLATFRGAKLGITRPHPAPADEWDGPFTVIANAAITVHRARQDRTGWLGRSHSLWYCDPKDAGRFGWFELAFMAPASRRGEVVPYSLPAQSATAAFASVLGTEQIAWPVTEIDRDDPSEFLDRWLGWFADAADGNLIAPAMLPDRDPSGSWRRA